MQLRDNKPGIIFPEHWGLFGGTIESGESVCEAASRELEEEIGIHIGPKDFNEFQQYIQLDFRVNTCFYDLPPSKIILKEGSDFGLFPIKKILKGKLFSKKFHSYFNVAYPLIGYFKDVSEWDQKTSLK